MPGVPPPAHQPLRHLEGVPHLFYLINFRPLITSHPPSLGLSVYSALLPHTSFLFFFLFATSLGIFNPKFPLTSYCPVGTRQGCWWWFASLGGWSLQPHCWAQPLPSPFAISVQLSLLCFWSKYPKLAIA